MVLLLGGREEEGEASQRLNVGVAFQLHAENTGNADGTLDALETVVGHHEVVAVLQAHAEGRQEGRPHQLEHGSHVLKMRR